MRWRSAEGQPITMLDVVKNGRPTILIGTSGQPGTFTEEIVRAMSEYVERPIIFPLSNPTSRAEATPADLIAWTAGRRLIATGSPFEDVTYDGRRFPIAQCNNSYVFPGLGLGILASGAQRVSDGMFMAAARALADYSAAGRDSAARLLPPLAESRQVSRDRPGRGLGRPAGRARRPLRARGAPTAGRRQSVAASVLANDARAWQGLTKSVE